MPKLHGSGEMGSLCTPGGGANRCTHVEELPGDTQSMKCVYAPCLSNLPLAHVAQ